MITILTLNGQKLVYVDEVWVDGRFIYGRRLHQPEPVELAWYPNEGQAQLALVGITKAVATGEQYYQMS